MSSIPVPTPTPPTDVCRHCRLPIEPVDGGRRWRHLHTGTATGTRHVTCGFNGDLGTSAAPTGDNRQGLTPTAIQQAPVESAAAGRVSGSANGPYEREDPVTGAPLPAGVVGFRVGRPTIVDRAEAALRHFGDLTRVQAEALLSTWRVDPELTSPEPAEVVAPLGGAR